MGIACKCAVGLVAIMMFASPADAAVSAKVDACLKSDDFRDGSNTSLLCVFAQQEQALDDHTKAQIQKKIGDAYYWSMHLIEAGLYYEKALALDPEDTETRLMKGRVLRRTNNLEEAYRITMEVVKDEPENATAIYDAGLIWAESGDNEKARAFYEAALKIDPNHILARANLAEYFRNNAREPDRALAEYDAVLALDKKKLNETKQFSLSRLGNRDFYLWATLQRADLLIGMERTEEAMKSLDDLIREYPSEPYLHVKRADILRTKGKLNAAIEESHSANEDCLSKFDNMVCTEGLFVEMDAFYDAKKYEESIVVAQKVSEGYFPPREKSTALYSIAFSKKRLGLKKEAMDAFLKSVEIDPSQGEVLLTQLTQRGYYEGATTDPINEKVKNGLEACMVDPECL